MKKILNIILVLLLTFGLTACNDNKSNEHTNGNTNSDNKSQVEDKYVPQKTALKDLPIYPGAILVGDRERNWTDENSNYWEWAYVTTGSGNEIVEFFKTKLQNLGFEIKESSITAYQRIFIIPTTDDVIYVSNSSFDKANNNKLPDEVNPDTPGREYSIIVNLDKWNKR